MRTLPLAIKLGVLAAVAAAALLVGVALVGSETQSAEGGQPVPAMSLRVAPAQQTSCPSPLPGKVCVGFGSKFDVIVVADALPASGYILAQAWIDYDNQGLVHKNNTVALWPDCDSRTFLAGEDVANNGAFAGCISDLVSPPPSFHVGDLLSFSLTCTPGASSSDIQLLPEGDLIANTWGAVYIEPPTMKVIPALTGITVSCVPQSTPGATSTVTPTPTGTPPPTPTLPPGPPAMSLRVDASQQGTCGSPAPGKVCVANGAKFDVIVVADEIPASGYIVAQAWIDYDSQGLVHKNNSAALWPDCFAPAFLVVDDVANNGAAAGCLTGIIPPLPISFHMGDLYSFSLTCDTDNSHTINLLPAGDPIAGTSGTAFTDGNGLTFAPAVSGITVNCVQLMHTHTPTPTNTPTPEPDTDGDGCSDQRENGLDETLGGRRDYLNPYDFYDVQGFEGAPPDKIIDLPNDILGVILHFSPLGYTPGTPALVGSGIYDDFDRGPKVTGLPWNMTAPDGVIDLPNDILGVILQHNHSCQ